MEYETAVQIFEDRQRLRAENEALKESREDAVRDALTTAFNLGQVYWRQADSESISAHRKANETLARFHDLLDSTIAALAAKGE